MRTKRNLPRMRNISLDTMEAITAFKKGEVFALDEVVSLILSTGDDEMRIRRAVYNKLFRMISLGELEIVEGKGKTRKYMMKSNLPYRALPIPRKKLSDENVNFSPEDFVRKLMNYFYEIKERNTRLESDNRELHVHLKREVNLADALNKRIEELNVIITKKQMELAEHKKREAMDVRQILGFDKIPVYPRLSQQDNLIERKEKEHGG